MFTSIETDPCLNLLTIGKRTLLLNLFMSNITQKKNIYKFADNDHSLTGYQVPYDNFMDMLSCFVKSMCEQYCACMQVFYVYRRVGEGWGRGYLLEGVGLHSLTSSSSRELSERRERRDTALWV